MHTHPTPVSRLPELPSKRADAANRAWRTFFGGLVAVCLAAGGTALTAALDGGVRWTRDYWVGLAAAVGLVVLKAAVAYVMRYTNPPPGSGS